MRMIKNTLSIVFDSNDYMRNHPEYVEGELVVHFDDYELVDLLEEPDEMIFTQDCIDSLFSDYTPGGLENASYEFVGLTPEGFYRFEIEDFDDNWDSYCREKAVEMRGDD